VLHEEELLTPVPIPTFLYLQLGFTPATIHISNPTSHADFGAATHPGVVVVRTVAAPPSIVDK